MPTASRATAAARVQAQAAQRDESKRATLEALLGKRTKEQEFTIQLNGSKSTLLMRAIGARDYDALLTKYPPTPDQKEQGAAFDIHSFGPALLARSCIEPEVSEKEWATIWNSQAWTRGEVMDLFWGALELTNKGLDLAPIEAD